jgi:uncharacterized repeat protein (TIGR03803 family)
MRKQFSLARALYVVYWFCSAAIIASPAQTLTTLYTFCSQGNCANGSNPEGALIQGTDGNLYGTAELGGSRVCSYGCGTVFKITPSGMPTTLYTFCNQFPCADGAEPTAALLQASDGNFYGTTAFGGGQTATVAMAAGVARFSKSRLAVPSRRFTDSVPYQTVRMALSLVA